jgi:SAM-dependent methyltransferase
MKAIDCFDMYSDGRRYDLKTDFKDDIPFYLHQIDRHSDPVLELMCGTGRVTIPIAEKGVHVAGVDVSMPMLTQAKIKAEAKGLDVQWINADVRDFKLDKKFQVVFIPINSITHLHDLESYEACFRCVREHLASDGRFIIDVFAPRLDILMRDASKRYPLASYEDPDGGGNVVVTENNVYDPATQINHIKWYFQFEDGRERVVEVNMRMLFPQELDSLLVYNGFAIEHKFGDYDLSPYGAASPKQLVVCGLK